MVKNISRAGLILYEVVQQVLDLIRRVAVPDQQSSEVSGIFAKAIGAKASKMINFTEKLLFQCIAFFLFIEVHKGK